jgi:HEAT repeat protein
LETIPNDNFFKTILESKKRQGMGDRFRLIYLKSPDSEKTNLEEDPTSYDPMEATSVLHLSSTHIHITKTFSFQSILKQARADLKHPDPEVRILAIQYLEKSDPSIAIPMLQEVLPDQDASVRIQVLSSLIKFQDPIICPLLKKCLKDSNPRVKVTALRGLFQLKEKVDLNFLLQLLSDESSWVKRKMATLLGWTQMEGTFPVLMEMSKDQDSRVRKAALLSLITLYPDESENRLVEAMIDSDPDLRKWARGVLEKTLARPLKRSSTLLQNKLEKSFAL